MSMLTEHKIFEDSQVSFSKARLLKETTVRSKKMIVERINLQLFQKRITNRTKTVFQWIQIQPFLWVQKMLLKSIIDFWQCNKEMRLRNLPLFITLAQLKIPQIQIPSTEKVDLVSLDSYRFNKIKKDFQILLLAIKLGTGIKSTHCLGMDRLEKFILLLITENAKKLLLKSFRMLKRSTNLQRQRYEFLMSSISKTQKTNETLYGW